MTNLDAWKKAMDEMDESDLAEKICYYFDCFNCPARKECIKDNGRANGLKKWLKEEAEES